MTLRVRFLLIATGVIIFLLVAPVVVFLARGYYFDFSKTQFVKTGTLSVKTEPRDAEVELQGKKLKNSPLVARFVIPGEYQILIRKQGHQAWQRTITVHPGQVTSLPDEQGKIFLLLTDPLKQTIPTTTVDFFREDQPQEEYDIALHNGKNALINKGQKDPVVLVPDLPQFKKSKIVVTLSRQIFLLLDENLYEVAETLKKINSPVAYARWDENDQTLVYGNSNEIWLYQPQSHVRNQLITRSLKPLGEAVFDKLTGYVFVGSGHEIKAIESRSPSPNIYVLASTKDETPKVSVLDGGTEVIYQDENALFRLNIR